MDSRNGRQASDHHDLLEAQAHIWNHTFNFINSMSLKCAIELHIPDIIHKHGQPMTLPEILAALPIHPTKARHVHRLMRILSHSGFFAQLKIGDDQQGYVLTPSSHLLLSDNPFSLSPFVLAVLDPFLLKPWQYASTWFQNDEPTPFYTAHGMSIWDCAGQEKRFGDLFNEAMANDSQLIASILVRGECKEVFEGVGTMVDVGGGTGALAKAIADAFPHMECAVLELPNVIADLKGSKNLKFIGGDMFESIPPAHAILLKWILHNWSDEECVKVLKQCKESIVSSGGEGGKVIIIDMVLESYNSRPYHEEFIETQLFFDMQMMIECTGNQRNEKQWAKLFSNAGFIDYKITSLLGLRSLIQVYL